MTNLVSYRQFDLSHSKLNCGLLQVITEKENKKLICGFGVPRVQGVTGESSLCFDTDEVIIHVTACVCTLDFFCNLMQTFENFLLLIPFWKFYFTSTRRVTKLESIYTRPFNLRKVQTLKLKGFSVWSVDRGGGSEGKRKKPSDDRVKFLASPPGKFWRDPLLLRFNIHSKNVWNFSVF